jgi:hypothetical protein
MLANETEWPAMVVGRRSYGKYPLTGTGLKGWRHMAKETVKSISVKQVSRVGVITSLIVVIGGCAYLPGVPHSTNITHAYTAFNKTMTQQQAIQLVSELGRPNADLLGVPGYVSSYRYSEVPIIVSPDQLGFDLDYTYRHQVSEQKYPQFARVSYEDVHVHEHLQFADISNIELQYAGDFNLPRGVLLITENGRKIEVLCFRNWHRYKEYLSALLVLCPNVK